jgi:hypothetical protein
MFRFCASGQGGQALEQGEIDVHVQDMGFKSGKAVGDGSQGSVHLVEVSRLFLGRGPWDC